MKQMPRIFGFLAFAVLTLAGCQDLGQVGGPGGYGSLGGSELIGEVRRVNTRDRQIELRSDSGRNLQVRYDRNTQVVYRQRDFAVADLEPGDYVAMRAQQDDNGRYYADYITVREAAQDRGAPGASVSRLDRIEGRAEDIDARRGSFEIRDRGRTVLVTLPYNPRRAVSDRFNRLREGDYVRIEGRFINEDRFELEGFL
jgi:Domain of unknown function (DUF5666)